MLIRIFAPWIVLAAILGFAMGGTLVFTGQVPIDPYKVGVAQPGTEHGGEKKHPHPFSRDWFTADPVAFATFALVTVTLGLAIVTGGLYFATARLARDAKEAGDKAITASAEAVNIARQDLISTHRPWISIEITIGPRGLYFDVNGANLELIFFLKNVGSTPAVAAKIEGSPRIDIKMKDQLVELDRICAEAKAKPLHPDMWGRTIFPNDTLTYPVIYSFASREDVDRIAAENHGFIDPVVIGCVDYVFTFGEPTHHQSRFLYELGWRTPDGIPRSILIADGNKAGSTLFLDRSRRARAFHAD
ncbi:MAG: hypothetical protein Q8L22_02335 [Reyranella sp.]|nr:hypothetical protein [Reyranella sp.]